MVNLTQLRNKISNKVFTSLGSSCLVSSVSTASIDKWGDATLTVSSQSTVTFVPWSIMDDRESFQSFGDLREGDLDAAFKYDQALEVGYEVVFDSTTYVVSNVEKFFLTDGVLVKVARLRKEL